MKRGLWRGRDGLLWRASQGRVVVAAEGGGWGGGSLVAMPNRGQTAWPGVELRAPDRLARRRCHMNYSSAGGGHEKHTGRGNTGPFE